MTKTGFQRLLRARWRYQDSARLRRIGDRLRTRLRQWLFENPTPDMDSHTDRMHRLLLLWLDLQRAIGGIRGTAVQPWNSKDQEVAALWEQITDPKNQRLLEEWLYQSAAGELELWAQQALLECRCRRRRGH